MFAAQIFSHIDDHARIKEKLKFIYFVPFPL